MFKAVVISSRYQLFLAWARDNYSGYEFDEVLNHYLQSGDFPEDFNIEYSGEIMEVLNSQVRLWR